MKDVTYLIQNQTPVVDSHTTVATALKYLQSSGYSHLPVTENGLWIGNIAKEDLMLEYEHSKISELRLQFAFFSTQAQTPWSIIWMNLLYHNSNMMPVVDSSGNFSGVYLKKDLSELWDNSTFYIEKGTLMLIQKPSNEYSLSQISQIIESNNAKVLHLSVLDMQENLCTILVKTNSIKTTEIIRAFRRFNYEILSHHLEDDLQNKLTENSQYLQKYLDI